MRRFTLQVTTAADGTATVKSKLLSGKIHSIQYVKDGANAYTDGVDVTITADTTGENILTKADVNVSSVFYPRAPTHSQAGVASLYAAGGTAIQDKIGLAGDRVKIALAQGGNAKTGTFHILVD